MAERTVAAPKVRKPPMPERMRNHERYVTPSVDIYETRDGLVVLADMPGVAQEALDIRVDKNVLTIRGHAHHGVPGEVVYQEYELVNFFKQFELSEHVDQRHITADLKSGVLTLHVPTTPRRIEVRVAPTHGASRQGPSRVLPREPSHGRQEG